MKPFEYYSTNDLPYPNRKDFEEYYLYFKSTVLAQGLEDIKFELGFGPTADLREIEEAVTQHRYILAKFFDDKSYRDAIKAFRVEESKKTIEFKTDLFTESGMVDHPKVELLYSKAYGLGHSSGFQEVYNYFYDLKDLVE